MPTNTPLWQSSAATIANGQTASDAIAIVDARSGLLTLPAAMTSNSLTFQTSPTLSGTFSTLKDSSGTNVSVTIANSSCVQIPAAVFSGAAALKIVGNSAEGAARALTIQLKS